MGVASKAVKPRACLVPANTLLTVGVESSLKAGIDKVLQGRQCAGFRLCVEFGESIFPIRESDNLLMVDDQLRHYGGDERLKSRCLAALARGTIFLKKLSTGLLSS